MTGVRQKVVELGIAAMEMVCRWLSSLTKRRTGGYVAWRSYLWWRWSSGAVLEEAVLGRRATTSGGEGICERDKLRKGWKIR